MLNISKYHKTLNSRQILTTDGEILTVNTTSGARYLKNAQGQGFTPYPRQTSPVIFSQKHKRSFVKRTGVTKQHEILFHWKLSSNRVNEASEGTPLGWRVDSDIATARGFSFIVTTFHPSVGTTPEYQDGSSGEQAGWRYFYGIQWRLNVDFDISAPTQTIEYSPLTGLPFSEWTQVIKSSDAFGAVDVEARIIAPYPSSPYNYFAPPYGNINIVPYTGTVNEGYGTAIGRQSPAGRWWPDIDIETKKQQETVTYFEDLPDILNQLPPYTGDPYDTLATVPVTVTNEEGIATFSVAWDTEEEVSFSVWFTGVNRAFSGAGLENYNIVAKSSNLWAVPMGENSEDPLTPPEQWYWQAYPGPYHNEAEGTIICFVISGLLINGTPPHFRFYTGDDEIDPIWYLYVFFDNAYKAFEMEITTP